MIGSWVSFDLETRPFGPGDMSPEPILATTAQERRPPRLHHGLGAMTAAFDRIADSPEHGFCGVNIAYDMRIVAKWLGREQQVADLYRSGRVIDLGLFERLLQCAGVGRVPSMGVSSPSLEALCRAYRVPMGWSKKDEETARIRVTFGDYAYPAELPDAHRAYALADAATGLQILHHQRKAARVLFRDARPLVGLGPLAALSEEHYWLGRWSAEGIQVDTERLSVYERAAFENFAKLAAAGHVAGLVEIKAVNGPAWLAAGLGGYARHPSSALTKAGKPKPGKLKLTLDADATEQVSSQGGLFQDGAAAARAVIDACLAGNPPPGWRLTINTKLLRRRIVAACEGAGVPVPMTVPKRDRKTRRLRPPTIDTAAKALKNSPDVELRNFARYKTVQKALTATLPAFRQGIVHPRVSFTDTLRVATGAPNVQNFEKKSFAPGIPTVRECLAVPEGWVVLVADYPALEEVTRGAAPEHWGRPGLAAGCVSGWETGIEYDAHSNLVGVWQGYGYAEALRLKKAKDAEMIGYRNKAKGMTFSFPVGASAATVAANTGAVEAEVAEVREVWTRANPDDGGLQAQWRELAGTEHRNEDGKMLFSLRCPGTRHIVAKRSYTQSLNGNFQPGGAACLQESVLRLGPAIWLGHPEYPALRGARWMQCTHDELVLAVPRERALAAALELELLMQDGACAALGERTGKVLRPQVAVLSRYSKDEAAFEVKDLQKELDATRADWHDAHRPTRRPEFRKK